MNDAAGVVWAGRRATLILTTALHGFTHGYQTLLVPLYVVMARDLGFSGVKPVALLVTIYLVVYALACFPAGIVADRVNRKTLLGVGLIGNALAILAMGLTPSYAVLVVLAIVGGLFGAMFHPAANALIAAHYAKRLGLAIGLLGIGSGLGFFVGARYSGWRAEHVTAGYMGMAKWQAPLVEAGIVGVVVGVAFLLLAREVPHHASQRSTAPLPRGLVGRVTALALVLGCRDFGGIATSSLVSIYLQRAHGYGSARTGGILGTMMLISMVANPVAVTLSSGRRRLPLLLGILVLGGMILMTIPHLSVGWILPVLAVFQVCHLGSYAVGEAAILERVAPATRGRVIGLFITIAGTAAATSPWVIGYWTDRLGARADRAEGYVIPFAAMGALFLVASLSMKLIAALGAAGESVGIDDVAREPGTLIEPG